VLIIPSSWGSQLGSHLHQHRTAISPPYIPISNLLFQVHLTCFYLSFELNSFGVMRKLVSKALTNLMAHFTFLAFNNFDIVALLC
jgi:hypothetical protein